MPSISLPRNLWKERVDDTPKQILSHEFGRSSNALSSPSLSEGELRFSNTPSESKERSDSELKEPLPLPPTWPIAPQFFRRRSCEMSTNMGPCIQKAVTHLEMVQDLIEQWFKSGEDLMKSRSQLSTQPADDNLQDASAAVSMELPEIQDEGEGYGDGFAVDSRASSRQLMDGDIESEYEDEDDTVLANIGADDVIDEVVTLLARLEKDRQDTEASYVAECGVVHCLNEQIGEQARIRLVDLPRRVQREHEACIMDMNELQWHVNYSIRVKDRIQSKTDTAEMFNKRLKEDIDFVQEHVPLIQEKLDLELSAMDKIEAAQRETNKELEETLARLAKTEGKSTEAHKKADKERNHIAEEIKSVEDKLKELLAELGEALDLTTKYVKEIKELQSRIEAYKKQQLILEVENELIKDKEERLSRDVAKLETAISEVNFEQNQLISINLDRKNKIAIKKKRYDNEVNDMARNVSSLEKESKHLTQELKNFNITLDDLRHSVRKCESDVGINDKEFIRIEREKQRCNEQIQDIIKQVDSHMGLFTRKKEEYEGEKLKHQRIEDALNHTVEMLKRQVRDEGHTRAILAARIGTDDQELIKSRQENEKKTKKASQVVAEVEGALEVVREKVANLRDLKVDVDEKLSTLNTSIKAVHMKHEETTTRHATTMAEKGPQLENLDKEFDDTQKKLNDIAFKIKTMTKHQEDMAESSLMMVKVAENTKLANDKLEKEKAEYLIQMAAAEKIYKDLQDLFANLKARMKDAAKKHRELIQARRDYLAQLLLDKERQLIKNTELASTYRQFQNDYHDSKNILLNTYEDRIRLEKSIKNLRQLLSLQKRMHLALLSYFKYRGLYHSSEYNKLEYEANGNSQAINSLKDEINETMKKMSHFLKTEVKSHAGNILPNLKISSSSILNKKNESQNIPA